MGQVGSDDIAAVEHEAALAGAPSLSRLLEIVVLAHAERTAVVDSSTGDVFTYAEFGERVRTAAQALQGLGIRPGDRVAIALPNSWQYAVTYFAVQAVGAVAVLVNIRFTVGEIEHVLSDSGSALVVTDAELRSRIPADARTALADEVTAAGAASGEWTAAERRPQDPANLLYTSGTTGKPKGAIQTHANLVFNAAANRRLYATTPDDRMLIAAPFFHATGLNSQLIGALSAGASVVIQPSFQKTETLQLLADHRITFFAGVSTMLQLLILEPTFGDRDLSSLRIFVLGGSPVQESVLDLADEHLPQTVLGNVWGLTEATSIVTSVAGQEFREHPRSVGRPIDQVEVAVWDEGSGAFATTPDEVGELCVRGPLVTAGYWQNAEATAQTYRDGWLHTGDVGRIDADGYVYVLDRTKDMIIRGGENVYSLEIENVLSAHPDVALVAAFPRPDEIFGERVCVAIVATPGSSPNESDLRLWAAQRLADYKVPVEWTFLDEMPLTASGKILKRELAGAGPGSDSVVS